MTKKVFFVILEAALVAALAPMVVAQDLHATNAHGNFTISSQQLNTLIALEATQNEIYYLTSEFGTPMSGQWHGTITNIGWTVKFAGSINGQRTRITESGSLEAETATWTDSGTVGATNLAGNGTAKLSGSDMDWSQAVTAGEDYAEFKGPQKLDSVGSLIGLLSQVKYLVNYDVEILLDTTSGTIIGIGDCGCGSSPSPVTTVAGSTTPATGKISYEARAAHKE